MTVKSGWPTERLSAICSISIGRTPSRSNPRYWNGTHPWLAISDMNGGPDLVSTKEKITDAAVDECRCRPVEPGTLLMSFKLSVGKLGFARRRLFTNEAIAALPIRDPNRDFAPYLFYALGSLDLLRGTDRAAMGRTLNTKKLEAIQVPRPPLDDQKRIAAVLGTADAIRRKRQQAIALTEDLLRSTFLEMFGDPMVNPKGWVIGKLSESFAAPPQIGTIKPATADGEVPVVRVGELGERDVALARCGRVDLAGEELTRFLLEPGDVVLARAIGSEAHLGKASVFQEAGSPVVFDSHVMRIRLDAKKLHPVVFLEWLKSTGGRARFMKKAGRTAVQFNINASQVSDIDIALPPPELQQKFLELADAVYRVSGTGIVALRCAEDLFSCLSQRAFQGNL